MEATTPAQIIASLPTETLIALHGTLGRAVRDNEGNLLAMTPAEEAFTAALRSAYAERVAARP